MGILRLKENVIITVEGEQYRVVENLGFQNGLYGKVVKTKEGERIVTRKPGRKDWHWASPVMGVYPVGYVTGQKGE